MRKRAKLTFRGIHSKKKKSLPVIQDRYPNFRDKEGNLYLVRCYACDFTHGRENWAMAVARGTCAFCGWREKGKKLDHL